LFSTISTRTVVAPNSCTIHTCSKAGIGNFFVAPTSFLPTQAFKVPDSTRDSRRLRPEGATRAAEASEQCTPSIWKVTA